MKTKLVLFFILIYHSFFSQSEFESISKVLHDSSMVSTLSNVHRFTNKSTTIKVNHYSPIFITVDTKGLMSTYNNRVNSNVLEGYMYVYITNKMYFDKSTLNEMACYRITNDRYLIFKIADSLKKDILNINTTCNCSDLYKINKDKIGMPTSHISYNVNYGIFNVDQTVTFDAIEFLKIHFLGD